MKTQDIREIVYRQPFRPFTLRLNNGAEYQITEPRQVGAAGDLHALYWFEPAPPFRMVRIDADQITEIIE
jgi:hypothetical protein